jgi:hypothetical protein
VYTADVTVMIYGKVRPGDYGLLMVWISEAREVGKEFNQHAVPVALDLLLYLVLNEFRRQLFLVSGQN